MDSTTSASAVFRSNSGRLSPTVSIVCLLQRSSMRRSFAAMVACHPTYRTWSKFEKSRDRQMYQTLVYFAICFGPTRIRTFRAGARATAVLASHSDKSKFSYLLKASNFLSVLWLSSWKNTIWISSAEHIKLWKTATSSLPNVNLSLCSQLQTIAGRFNFQKVDLSTVWYNQLFWFLENSTMPVVWCQVRVHFYEAGLTKIWVYLERWIKCSIHLSVFGKNGVTFDI